MHFNTSIFIGISSLLECKCLDTVFIPAELSCDTLKWSVFLAKGHKGLDVFSHSWTLGWPAVPP